MSQDDPCRYDPGSPRSGGTGKMLYLPGQDDITKVFVEMADQNRFNQTHHLTFNWLEQCHRLALITALPN